VAIGAIHLATGSSTITAQEADEYNIVCDGHLTLTSQGETLELADSDSAVPLCEVTSGRLAITIPSLPDWNSRRGHRFKLTLLIDC
jgi:hypothetical protein